MINEERSDLFITNDKFNSKKKKKKIEFLKISSKTFLKTF
mgnify:CR=1 FL=1